MACSRIPLVITGSSKPRITTAMVAHHSPDDATAPNPPRPPHDGGGSPGRVGGSRVVRATPSPSHSAVSGYSSRRVRAIDPGEPQPGGVDLGWRGEPRLVR